MSQRWIAILVLGCVLCDVSLGGVDMFMFADVTGSWHDVVGGGWPVSCHDNQPISYGSGSENQVRWGILGPARKQSGLGFTGVVPPPLSFAVGDPFEIGLLRHFNYRVVLPAATQADLSIHMAFTSPGIVSQVFTFTFEIDETPNVGGDIPDRIDFPSSLPSETFSIDGTTYTLELLGFSGNTASPLIPYFLSQEETDSSAVLWGRITADAPPVPAPGALLLSVLGATLTGWWRRTHHGNN